MKQTMSAPWDDPRIRRGMTEQLAKRRARIDAGEQPLGWKVGFGAQAAKDKFRITAPLVGFLMQRALVPSGGTVSFKGWVKPVAEPEIAIHIGHDLAGGGDRAAAAAAIAALSPAIELADFDAPPATPEDVEAVLSGNIFQRHVLVGPRDETRAGGRTSGLAGRVIRRGAEIARTSDPEENTGALVDTVRHVADLLAAFGEQLRAGDIIIGGSVVAPLFIEPDENSVTFALDPVGSVSVRFAH
jgi:2-keto-4-pentenoate hydratase